MAVISLKVERTVLEGMRKIAKLENRSLSGEVRKVFADRVASYDGERT